MTDEERLKLRKIKPGEYGEYEKIFKANYRALTLFAQRYVFDLQIGEDIVQDVFVQYWENLNRTEIKSSLKAYLYQSVKNRCLNYLRNRNVYDKHKILFLEACLSSRDPEVFTDPELSEAIEKALGQLPPEMAKVMRLRYLDEKKLMEVAQMLCISKNTVKTQLLRGKSRLRELIPDLSNLNVF